MEAEVILVRSKFPGGIGAVFRIIANFGINKLILVNPSCDYLSEESRRFAKNSQDILLNAEIVSSLDEIKNVILIGTTGKTGFFDNILRFYLTPKELALDLNKDSKIGLVFGNEESGLSKYEIEKCSFLVHIPAGKGYPVLNISHSTAIIIYEFFNSNYEKRKTADKKELESVSFMIDKISEKICINNTEKKVLNNILNRAVIQKLEARTLAGFFSKILKKIQFEKRSER